MMHEQIIANAMDFFSRQLSKLMTLNQVIHFERHLFLGFQCRQLLKIMLYIISFLSSTLNIQTYRPIDIFPIYIHIHNTYINCINSSVHVRLFPCQLDAFWIYSQQKSNSVHEMNLLTFLISVVISHHSVRSVIFTTQFLIFCVRFTERFVQ